MNMEPCFVCRGDAIVTSIEADKYDVRCEKCGKYIFHDGLHEDRYKNLSEEEIERISKYIKDHYEETKRFAELSIYETLWIEIEGFYKNR